MSDQTENKMPKRCSQEGCKCKLKLTDYACRCGKFYCASHRLGEYHNCTFDYKQHHKELLLKYLSTPVVGEKVAII